MRDYKVQPMEDEPNPFDNIKWEEIKPSEYRTFQWGTEPELIHIIKTGFENRYIVVYEDAYELVLGKAEIYTKEEIQKRFKIEL